MAEHAARPRVSPGRRRLLRAARVFFTPLLPDDYLELIDPLWSSREVRGRIESIAHETADAVTMTIRPAGRWGELLRGGGADRSASAPAPSEPVRLRQPTRRSTG